MMDTKTGRRARALLAAAVFSLASFGAWGQAPPPDAIPTMSLSNVARQGFFYVGGHYVNVGDQGEKTMGGAMYVEVMVPKQIRHPYPIVFMHAAGNTGTQWLQTPDGRPGWAYNFIDMGYVVYLEDFPARGRSQYVPGVDGDFNIRTGPTLERVFTASAARADFPQADKHTEFPGTGLMGDPIFDKFAKTQVQFIGGKEEAMARDANVALLDRIASPVILLTHSQGGDFGWLVADARPNLVKAIVTVEPAGPPIRGVDTSKVAYIDRGGLAYGVSNGPITYDPPVSDPAELNPVLESSAEGPGLVPCYVQREPAHKLENLEQIPVLFLNGEGGYHREFDHCLAKWLNQAGAATEYVRLEDVGIRGNGHMMMLEKNSADIAKYIGGWLDKTLH